MDTDARDIDRAHKELFFRPLAGHYQEIQADRDRKLEAGRIAASGPRDG